MNNPMAYNPYIQQGVNWVNGYDGVRMAQLRPGSSAMFLDNDGKRMYIKSCDNVGMCNIRVFKVTEEQPQVDGYVTREEYQNLLERLERYEQHTEHNSNDTTEPKQYSTTDNERQEISRF